MVLTFQDALDRIDAYLANPPADLSEIREEIALVAGALITGKFGYTDGACKGLRLWGDPEEPDEAITIRNGIFTFREGGRSHMVDARRLWETQISRDEAHATIYFGHVFGEGKTFNDSEIVTGLERIFGCRLKSAVRHGWDGFFHYVFDRVFKEYDRQRLKAETAVTFLNDYSLMYGSEVIVSTGRIEVICRLPPKKED